MTTAPYRPTAEPSAHLRPPLRAAIRRRLLRWYDRNARDLPWRRRRSDPYAQWVAEVMLQQTRVDTVIERYERFLRRFPTVDALARADHEEVLKYWEGLGYYRRALQLHRAARLVHERGTGIPQTAAELRRLPGLGPYTAAAVASIAFNHREAAVDGNVARVIARLFAVSENVLSAKGRAHIHSLAAELMPAKRPGDFNQAWMDLGSLVCTPKSPQCPVCPLLSPCAAAATDRIETLPIRHGNRKITDVTLVVGVFVHNGRMLVRRRPTGGLWSGLWEFPNADLPQSEHAAAAGPPVRRQATGHRGIEDRAAGPNRPDALHVHLLRGLARTEGLSISTPPQPVAVVRHRLTHRALTFHVYLNRVDSDGSAGVTAPRRWVTLRGFGELPVSTAHRRILAGAQAAVIRAIK